VGKRRADSASTFYARAHGLALVPIPGRLAVHGSSCWRAAAPIVFPFVLHYGPVRMGLELRDEQAPSGSADGDARALRRPTLEALSPAPTNDGPPDAKPLRKIVEGKSL